MLPFHFILCAKILREGEGCVCAEWRERKEKGEKSGSNSGMKP